MENAKNSMLVFPNKGPAFWSKFYATSTQQKAFFKIFIKYPENELSGAPVWVLSWSSLSFLEKQPRPQCAQGKGSSSGDCLLCHQIKKALRSGNSFFLFPGGQEFVCCCHLLKILDGDLGLNSYRAAVAAIGELQGDPPLLRLLREKNPPPHTLTRVPGL